MLLLPDATTHFSHKYLTVITGSSVEGSLGTHVSFTSMVPAENKQTTEGW